MTKLEDFIAETLRQIISGVKQAQAYAAEHGGTVSPSNIYYRGEHGVHIADRSDGTLVSTIEFDVAVTTIDATSTKGGVGVFVGPIGLGSQGQSNASSQSVSHIKFSVPVRLPEQARVA